MTNALGLIISFGYILGIIGVAEWLHRWRNFGSDFTRKFAHIGVGTLSWALPWLFDSPVPFIIACLAFMTINYLDWRYGFFAAMVSSDRSNLGTVFFPLAAGVAALVFWDRPPLMVAALMPLTWGDGLASVIGQAFGRHRFSVRGHTRTLQGSAAFFMAGGLFTWLALWLLPGPPELTAVAAFLPTLSVMAATTFIEAVTIKGLDNLTVTAVAMLVLSLWRF